MNKTMSIIVLKKAGEISKNSPSYRSRITVVKETKREIERWLMSTEPYLQELKKLIDAAEPTSALIYSGKKKYK